MYTQLSSSQHPLRILFYFFLFAHVLLWSIAPAYIRLNLPLDAIEGTIWGQELQWGYDKNPFLNGWLTALTVYLSAHKDWAVYFGSQCSVALCLWSVWKLGYKLLPAAHALVAVLVLEAVQYYNFHAVDFNDNTLELGFWAVTIYSFYLAIFSEKKSQHYFAWTSTGLFAALAMMAKYYTAALLAAMVLFMLTQKSTRQQLKTFPPYFGLSIFLAVISPHLVWLFNHDFITVYYVFARGSSPYALSNHLLYPLKFAWQQLEVFLPACTLLALLKIGKKSPAPTLLISLNSLQQKFLYFIGLGPFFLTLALSFLLSIKLRAGWGMPLLSLWGIILLVWLKPILTFKKIIGFGCIIFCLSIALALGYMRELAYSDTPTSANFPGPEIAHKLTQKWHATYKSKLSYVAGSRWIGGNISYYSNDQPHVFIEWNSQRAPWINYRDLLEKGGIFTWDISAGESLPTEIREKFPHLLASEIYQFAWRRDEDQRLRPIKIGIAILPPGGTKEGNEQKETLLS